MRRGLGQFLTALLLVIAIGGHWVILQSFAWAGMLVKFSQTDSVKTAIVKVFDGKHLCSVCKFVRAGAKQEKEKSTSLQLEKKLDPWLIQTVPESPAPEPYPFCIHVVSRGELRAEMPALPPPRFA